MARRLGRCGIEDTRWRIERLPTSVRLHCVLDVAFNEDLSRLRSGAGSQNMATVRQLAMRLLRGTVGKHSPKS